MRKSESQITMPPRMAPRKNYCLTVYPDHEADPRTAWNPERMTYLIVGNETCPEMPPRMAPRKNYCLTVYPDHEADPRTAWNPERMTYLIVGKAPELTH